MGRVGTIAGLAVAMALLTGAVPLPASAQTLNDAIAGRASGQGQSRLLVEAKEIVYDNDRNTVSARGEVELSYQGRTLQADRVTYDRNTGRVFAEGNARLTEANGSVVTGSRFELTDDFKNGFIDSLRVEQTTIEAGRPLTARFSAPRAERIEGEQTVFERGTYTACEPCKNNPERPPLWQVKAARIIHNNSERTIYYENATLELAGIPVAYMPYFWTPDPTVKRKTGFLAPRYVYSSALGYGASIPFFWAIAPNYDLTIRPTILSQQGVLGEAEWRHRLATGAYTIRGAGIFQQDHSVFLPSPLGPRGRDFRGSLETTGRFHINERWQYGWDVALLTDKWFLNNYRIRSESTSQLLFRSESISTAYLQGQGDRSFFDMRGYYFKVLSSVDWQKQQPVVHPVLDYNKRVNGPQPLGGELAVDVNLTSLSRETAQFEAISGFDRARVFPGTDYLYETCAIYERGRCFVRGLAGTNTRLSTQVSWRRQFIDPLGQAWTPFAYFRADGFWYRPNTTDFLNVHTLNFVEGDNDFVGRAMPAIGLDYRYPFVADAGALGVHTFQPIVQVVARPSETRIGHLPNEDAQSLVFDETTLFSWDKFSGYDRVEGGLRANLGAQYLVKAGQGFQASALVGRSVQLAGINSFRPGDLVNTGRDSGLESRRSDYVGGVQVSPWQQVSFFTRGRFDEEDFGMRRLEAGATASLAPSFPLTTSLMYARYAPQPELGFDKRREGIAASANLHVTPNWFVNGAVSYDLDYYLDARQKFAMEFDDFATRLDELRARPDFPALSASPSFQLPAAPTYERDPLWYATSVSLGGGYTDECTTFSINYIVSPRETATGTTERVRTVLLRLELRTLGQAGLTQSLDPSIATDGVAAR